MQKRGFTLVEVLITISILVLIFSVSLPISFSMYKYYKESQEVDKFVIFLSTLRREAFLYNKEHKIAEKDGFLIIDDKATEIEGLKFSIDTPIIFYKNGTSSGGTIIVYTPNFKFKIEISAPFGEIKYEKN
jgi:prepilin-type N-terminal cleavage/methylation domain-containing protein